MEENINTLDVRETEQVVENDVTAEANIQTITTETVESATVDSEATEEIDSIEETKGETETEGETEEAETEAEEYDWEADISKRVVEVENKLETLIKNLDDTNAKLSALLEEKEKRNKKLSGFFKPVESVKQLPKDDNTITYDDLYTLIKK